MKFRSQSYLTQCFYWVMFMLYTISIYLSMKSWKTFRWFQISWISDSFQHQWLGLDIPDSISLNLIQICFFWITFVLSEIFIHRLREQIHKGWVFEIVIPGKTRISGDQKLQCPLLFHVAKPLFKTEILVIFTCTLICFPKFCQLFLSQTNVSFKISNFTWNCHSLCF